MISIHTGITPSAGKIERGLYQCANGKAVNADVNSALNILKKYCCELRAPVPQRRCSVLERLRVD